MKLGCRVILLGLATGALLLAGCGSDSETSDVSAGSGSSATESGAAPTGRFKVAAACLLRNQYEPCGALTEEVVRQALPQLGTTELESKSYTQKPREPKEGRRRVFLSNISSCTYRWPSDMKMSIKLPGGASMDVPKEAEVSLSGIIEYPENPLAEFKRTHRTPTAEETAQLNARVEEKLEEARADGKIPESGKAVGKGLAQMALSGIAYEEVAGVGTAALWESKHQQLSVLVESVKIDVSARISDDPTANAEAARALGAALLEACQ